MKRNSLISIVIPYYDGKDSLQRLVGALGDEFPIIVVSNARQHPIVKNAEVIELPINTGFAHAANLGAQRVKTPYIFFANPDIHITPRDITRLLEWAKKRQYAAASPTLVNESGEVQKQYHQPLPGFSIVVQQFTPLQYLLPSMSEGETLPGAALLIQKAILDDLSGWDERLWLWWEDADLSLRLSQGGHAFGRCSEVRIEHVGGETFSVLDEAWKRQVFFHSLRIFAKKHFGKRSGLVDVITNRFHSTHFYPADENFRVSIVVPNVRLETLVQFLQDNVATFDFRKDELIIVTSAHTIESLQREYPEVIFVHLSQNNGFADTVNIGLRRARGQVVGTVNDDVSLPKGWISRLLSAMDTSVGSVAPIVIGPQGEVETAGMTVLSHGKVAVWKQMQKNRRPDAFNAAAVLLNRKALEDVGLFDTHFGSYLEDIDLGLRMKANGWKHSVVPEVRIVHFGQQTSSRRPVYKAWLDAKNWWLVVLKNWSVLGAKKAVPVLLVERARNISGVLKAFFRK